MIARHVLANESHLTIVNSGYLLGWTVLYELSYHHCLITSPLISQKWFRFLIVSSLGVTLHKVVFICQLAQLDVFYLRLGRSL